MKCFFCNMYIYILQAYTLCRPFFVLLWFVNGWFTNIHQGCCTGAETIISPSSSSVPQYSDVIMSKMESQITGVSIFCSTVGSGVDKRKIEAPRHRPLGGEFTGENSPHKRPETRKMFPFDDVIMRYISLIPVPDYSMFFMPTHLFA